MRHPNFAIGAFAPALVALFLFIAHLGESFSTRRFVIEVVLALPLAIYLTAIRSQSRV